MLRSTTRPCTENVKEVAPSELLAICGWVEVIVTLAGLMKIAMISRAAALICILVTLEVSLHGGKSCTTNRLCTFVSGVTGNSIARKYHRGVHIS